LFHEEEEEALTASLHSFTLLVDPRKLWGYFSS
jgi:hypothetical protein